MKEDRPNTTMLLNAVASGDADAGKKLFTLLYDEIHSLAHRSMRKEAPGHILQTTALVNEAYLKLVPNGKLRCDEKVHFFRIAGRAMRQILISEARRGRTAKRGRGIIPFSLNQTDLKLNQDGDAGTPYDDLEALDCALEKMERNDGNRWMTDLVELRFFAGLSFRQIADILGVSKSKVVGDWTFTRTWLREEIDR